MTWIDYAILAIVGFSILLGIFRGLVRELISILGLVLAFVVATIFSGQVAVLLAERVGAAATAVAFVGIVLVVWVLAGIIGFVVSRLVKAVGLGWSDRLLGAGFGLARGVILVLASALVAGLTPLPEAAVWKNAMLSGTVESAVVVIKPMLPLSVSERVHFR